MRIALRTLAMIIAAAAALDPAVQNVISRPAPVEVLLPPTSHPDYARALSLRTQVVEQLAAAARFDTADPPRALLAVGRPHSHTDPATPLLAWSLPAPAISIEAFEVPRRATTNQRIVVRPRLRGRGLDGQLSTIRLRAGSVTLASSEHRWSGADEVYAAEFTIPALPEGTHRLQVVVDTGAGKVSADESVMVNATRHRVLVYEPRPSWPAAFARRSLEQQRAFHITTLARSAPGVTTTSGERPPALSVSRLEEFDVVVLGGLDEVSDTDARVLTEFVSRRGGSVVLLPDGRVPEGLRRRLGLPALEELLLEQPVLLDGGPVRLRASELLVPAPSSMVTTLLAVQREQARRPVVFATPFGDGSVVLVGAMDAWRYRSAKGQDLGQFTASLIADAAAAAPAPLDVSLTHAIERPGEPVTIVATLRQTELSREGDGTVVPRIAAAIIDEKGTIEMLRLWPTARAGEFEGETQAPRPGRYVVEVTAGTRKAAAVLTIAEDVTHARNGEYPLAAAAALTGGAVHDSLDDLRENLVVLGSVEETVTLHPMRSPWWIVPFVALLSAEWILRRRAGLR